MNTISRLFIALGAAALAWSCSSDPETPINNGGDEEKGTTYLRVEMGTVTPSRSNPTGGEEGDGSIPGTNHEDEIHDLNLFVYYDAEDGAGLDATESTPFLISKYLDNTTLAACRLGTSQTYLIPVDPFMANPTHRIAVVANVGDITASVTNLGQLRTYQPANSFTAAAQIQAYDRFIMANAYNGARHASNDGRVRIPDGDQPGSRENPLLCEVWLERMAARFDLMFDNDFDEATATLPCEVQGTANRVMLTHAMPVNVMQKGSFLFKHVTEGADINGATLICGDELLTPGSATSQPVPANYVIEPRTALKTSATPDVASWFGATAIGTLSEASSFAGGSEALRDAVARRTTLNDDGHRWSTILGYGNENTAHCDVLDTQLLTGLLLRAVYSPATVYSSIDAATGEPTAPVATTVTTGGLTDASGNSVTLVRYSPTAANGTVDESSALYFNNVAAANAYAALNPADRAVITVYPAGMCYYNIWVRHAGEQLADPHVRYPMEFGVVRNNVYRIGFTFHGPGSPDIVHRLPENIDARVFVRPWAFRRHPVIIM